MRMMASNQRKLHVHATSSKPYVKTCHANMVTTHTTLTKANATDLGKQMLRPANHTADDRQSEKIPNQNTRLANKL